MRSKLLLLPLISVLAFGAGCGIKLGEKNKTESVAQIKGADCLKPSLADFRKYLAGDATDEQVEEALVCLQSVLKTFRENVRGQDKNSFTPEEIGNFISKEYLKDADPLPPSLVLQVAKLKAALVGGDGQSITKDEINAISDLLGRYKSRLVGLNPHIKVLVGKWNPEEIASPLEREQKFLLARDGLLDFAGALAKDLGSSGYPYELRDLLSLVSEAGGFIKLEASTLKTIQDAAPLVLKFKSLLVGGGPALKGGSEWMRFNLSLGNLAVQALRIKYFYTPLREDQKAEKWKVYQDVAFDLTGLLYALVDDKPGRVLKNSEIYELVQAAEGVIPGLQDINEQLVQQAGSLKVALLGDGSAGASGWSAGDFQKLQNKIPSLLKSAAVVVGNYKVLLPEGEQRAAYADFGATEALVLNALQELTGQIEGSYDLNVLKATAHNLADGILKDKLKLPEDVDRLFALAESAKLVLTGDPGPVLTAANIRQILIIGSHVLGHFAEYSGYIKPFPMNSPAFIANVDRLFAKVKPTLALELQLKASHVITTPELTQLVLAAQEQKFIKATLKKNSLDEIFNALWSHVLNNPEDRLKGIFPSALGGVALKTAAGEIQLWIENQKVIADVFSQKNEYSKEELLAAFDGRLVSDKGPALQASLRELRVLLAAKGEMNFNEQNFLKILSEGNGRYHVRDLTNSNLSRAGARVLIRSFAMDAQRVKDVSGITVEEAQAGFQLVKDVLIDFKLITASDSETFIPSRFKESSLFLSVSDGDSLASLSEIHNLVLHILSGIARADVLNNRALEKCVVGRPATKADAEFTEDCFIDVAFKETEAFKDLPQLLALRQKYTEEENKTYYLALLKAAGYVPNDNKTVRISDAGLFPHVAQYVEMLYFSHDTDRDGLLQKEEAFRTFPVFKNLLTLLTKPFPQILEDDQIGVFIYLLKNGRPPKGLAEKIKFVAFAKDHDCSEGKVCQKGWDIQSNRLDIGKIFNFIADATKPTTPAPPPVAPPADPAPVVPDPAAPVSPDPSPAVPASPDPTPANP